MERSRLLLSLTIVLAMGLISAIILFITGTTYETTFLLMIFSFIVFILCLFYKYIFIFLKEEIIPLIISFLKRLPLLLSLKTRINRYKYLIRILILLILTSVSFNGSLELGGFNFLSFLVIVFFSLMGCVTVQRLHDLNRPGVHYFLTWIPIYSIYMCFVLFSKKGTDGPNQYGEDPLVSQENL
ncbi:DUF805 domain-containing protein [Tepidibacter mesophilus]|uniref:DUF805 domain-containing protein n=1 Tax=Tepidibacter mesophilus TaxID=655607 RepID=UPI001651A243|nr:DUF805 domain-containing protein [Tepidibacter mesophilus]